MFGAFLTSRGKLFHKFGAAVIYPGAKPLIALNIKSKILNSMWNVTGNQCKLYNNGVILQYLG